MLEEPHMTDFMHGVISTLEAVLAAIKVRYPDAHAFISREFYEPRKAEQADWTLRSIFNKTSADMRAWSIPPEPAMPISSEE
jgi:hypothetical protein